MGIPFVHVELMSTDVGKAKAFYGKLFDWKLENMDMAASARSALHASDAAIIDRGDNKDLVNELMRITVPIYLDDGETEPFAVVAGIRKLLTSTR
jgi:predicted enzyme related to lactoylglutathione lyase